MATATTTVIHERIVAYVQRHPELKLSEIAQKLHISKATLSNVLHKAGFRRKNPLNEIVNHAELEK